MLGNTQKNALITNFAVYVAIFTLLGCGTSGAVEVQAQFTLGIAETDNVARTPSGEIDETIYILGIDYDLSHESRKLTANIQSSFNYMHYVDDTFDAELIGGFVGFAELSLVEERVDWIVLYNWGQQLQDIFEPARPDNRDDVSIFSTGPRFTQPLGERTAVGLDVTYTNTQFETRPLDFERFGGELQLAREVRSGMFLSVNVSADRVEYQDNQFLPFDTTEAFLRFDSESGRNIFEIDVGYTEVESDGVTGTGPLFTAEWTRNMSPTTSLRLGGGTRYSDQGDIFRFFQTNSGNLNSTNSISTLDTPFRNDYVLASLSYIKGRTTLVLGAFLTDEDYELEAGNVSDRSFASFDMELARELSRRTFVRLRAEYRSDEYDAIDRRDKNFTGSVTAGFRFTTALNATLTYLYFRRDSSVAATDAIENRVMLQIGYIPRWGR